MASFRRATRDDQLAESIRADWRRAPLTAGDRALAEYAEALTTVPSHEPAARVRALRDAGWDDAAILRATEIVGYFNFVNRLADGLGVELEVKQ